MADRRVTLTIDGNARPAVQAAKDAAQAVREVGTAATQAQADLDAGRISAAEFAQTLQQLGQTPAGTGLGALSRESEAAGAAFIELSARLAEAKSDFAAGTTSVEQFRASMTQIAADAEDVVREFALTNSEIEAFVGLATAATQAAANDAQQAERVAAAFTDLRSRLAELRAEYKAGRLSEEAFVQGLRDLNGALLTLGNTEQLTAAQQSSYNSLLVQTTPATRAATTAFREIQSQLATLRTQYQAGEIGIAQYNAQLAQLRQRLQEVAAQEQLTSAEQRTFNALQGQLVAVAPRAVQGMGTVRSAVAALATQAIGAKSSVGALVGGLGLMLGGSALALGVTLGLAAVVTAIDLLTEKSREAKKATDDLIEALLKEQKLRSGAAVFESRGAVQARVNRLRDTIAAGEQERTTVEDGTTRARLIDAQLARLRGELRQAETALRQFDTDSVQRLIAHAQALAQLRDAGKLRPEDREDITATRIALDIAKGQAKTAEERAAIEGAITSLTKERTTHAAKLTAEEKAQQKALEAQAAAAADLLRADAARHANAVRNLLIQRELFLTGKGEKPEAPAEEPAFSIPAGTRTTPGGSFTLSADDLAKIEAAGDAALASIDGLATELTDLGADAVDTLKGGLVDLFQSGTEGAEAMQRAVVNLLAQLERLALNALVSQLFGSVIRLGTAGISAGATAGGGIGGTTFTGGNPFADPFAGSFATGGLVGGVGGTDSHLARVTPGEFVLTPEATQAIGVDRLRQWNADGGRTALAGGMTGGAQRLDIGGGLHVSLDEGLVARQVTAYLETREGKQQIAAGVVANRRFVNDGLRG